MLDITDKTLMVEISRDITKTIEEKGLHLIFDNDVEFDKQLFVSRLKTRSGRVIFESKSGNWRNAQIAVHDYLKENFK